MPIVHADDFNAWHPMAISITENFLSNLPVLANTVIFLCTASVCVVSSQTDSKYLTVVDNNEINRSIRFRVVFEYLTHKHVFPSSLRASDNISVVLATQNVKQPFGHVVALLITILVLLTQRITPHQAWSDSRTFAVPQLYFEKHCQTAYKSWLHHSCALASQLVFADSRIS